MSYEDTRFQQTLTDRTMKVRRNLLVVSLVSSAIATTGLVPTEITALGLKLSAVNQQDFLKLLLLVVGYYLIAFFLYSLCDFFSWWKPYSIDKKHIYVGNDEIASANKTVDLFFLIVRIVFEHVLPLPIGLYAIFVVSDAIQVLK